MLQLEVIREEKGRIVAGLRKRNWTAAQVKVVDQIIALDDRRKSVQKELDESRAEMNLLSKSIGKLMGQGKKEEDEGEKEEGSRPRTPPLMMPNHLRKRLSSPVR